MVQIPISIFFWDPRLPALASSEASHTPVLKHTRAERKTQHLSVFVQCVGISWQSYYVCISFLFFFFVIHHKSKLLDEQ